MNGNVSGWLPNYFIGDTKVIALDDMIFAACEYSDLGEERLAIEVDQIISSVGFANHSLKMIMNKVVEEDAK
ncbi:hypothetical protein M316_0098 [Nitrincola phage 1M3-16]|uniref:hypothetical protein n=1 Tax=Nitrincola phage 1M3-16 TaxID=1472912 RepID=UPI000444D826|nr:hypothetical protein GJ22_gp054 [Nitrincola phage 1M3-16]AHX01163.1 hypothetical protein M316_0098 [Nitrincola phage 1M3-16]